MFGHRKQRAATSDAPVPSVAVLQEEIARLKQTVQQLALLNDLAQAIGLSESSNEMIGAIVQRAKQAIGADQVMVYFIDHSGDEDTFKTVMRDRTVPGRHLFHFDEALRAMMEFHRAPYLTNDPQHDSRLQGVAVDADLRSLLCVPLMVRGKLTGLVAACNKKANEGFDAEDERLLSIIANSSAQILENTRLNEDQAAYERLNRDVQMARVIQTGLLPAQPPLVDGYDIAGCSVPAETMGGDYFDYLEFEDGRIGIGLGDVSGKGVPASLLMANLQATLRGQARIHASPAECMTWSNRLLFNSTAPDKFATLFYGILDPAAHRLTYCNAGHEPPMLLSCNEDGECCQDLQGGGPIVGVIDDYAYTEVCADIAPGALMLIYSDGLTDAVDAFDVPFGLDRVLAVLRSRPGATAQEVIDALLDAVKQHCAGAPAFDDVTLVVVRRDP